MVTRVLIADDHPLYRAGLRLMLEDQPDIELVGDAVSIPDLLDSTALTAPDVVVLDVGMPGGDGIDAAARLLERNPELAVLVVTMHDDPQTAARAMRAGARGYLVKGAAGDDVLLAVRAIAAGQYILDAAVGRALLRSGTAGQPEGGFTDRERDILRLMAAGLTNAAIAESLFLSDKTVRNYVSSIFHKTGAANRVDALARARKAGWA